MKHCNVAAFTSLVAISLLAMGISSNQVSAQTSQMQAYAGAMQIEDGARASDSPYAWQQAAQAWLKHYPNMVQSREEKLLATKRATACSVRAYEAATRTGNKEAIDTASQELFGAYHRMQVLEPANPAWHYLLGVGYTTQGDYLSARQSLSEAVKMAPNSDIAKKAIEVANHNLPAVRQAQAAHDAYENSPRGKMARQIDNDVAQGNLYRAQHPQQPSGNSYMNDPYFRWKQYNANHTPTSYDNWRSNNMP